MTFWQGCKPDVAARAALRISLGVGGLDGATISLIISANRRQATTRASTAVLWLLLAVAGGCLLPAAGRAAESVLSDGNSKYFRELRRRGLFRLAESYCLEKLSHERLTAAERADLTLELARTLSEHASFAPEPEQAELWKRSQSILEEFVKREP